MTAEKAGPVAVIDEGGHLTVDDLPLQSSTGQQRMHRVHRRIASLPNPVEVIPSTGRGGTHVVNDPKALACRIEQFVSRVGVRLRLSEGLGVCADGPYDKRREQHGTSHFSFPLG